MHAAVDVESVPGDVAGGVGGEKEDGGGYVGVGTVAGEGDLGENGGLLGFVEFVSHGGLDETGGDGVDGDAAGGELACQGLGEADEAGFGGGVVGLAGGADFADNGGDVDDATGAGFHHGRDDSLGEQEGAGEVGAEDVIEVGELHAEGESVFGDAGVVDEDVDGAEVGEDLFGGGLDGVFAGDVECVGAGGSAGGGNLGGYGFEFVEGASREGDGGAGFGEREGAGAADSL